MPIMPQDSPFASKWSPLSRRQVVAGGAGMAAMLSLPGSPVSAATAHQPAATAVTEVFGDGQKLVAVALDYHRPIDGRGLRQDAFQVADRRVVDVFTSTSVNPADRAVRGRFVIIALDANDPAAALRKIVRPMGTGGPHAGGPPPGDGPPPHFPPPSFKPAQATVTAIGRVKADDGTRLAPLTVPLTTTAVSNLVVDEFRQLEFHDPETGDLLRYNLFLPKGYDRNRRYPLVLFMHDASVLTTDTTATLRQGLGAIAWAGPVDQAKHPCLVLAPQYDAVVVNDRSEATSLLDTTVDLVRQVMADHAVDPLRVYATGQSMGAMMTIAMNIKYPGLIAASYIVAGQWDVAKVAPLAQDKLWITVSQGDLKAYPGENALTAVLEQQGARVSRAVWRGMASPAELAADVARLRSDGAMINYVALAKGTVVPPGMPDDGGSNHTNTWRIAYSIPGIRDWIMEQHR